MNHSKEHEVRMRAVRTCSSERRKRSAESNALVAWMEKRVASINEVFML